MTEWQAIAAGFAFYLIFEGLMPFFNPSGFKQLLLVVKDMSDDSLRKMGGLMLILGVILLFSVK